MVTVEQSVAFWDSRPIPIWDEKSDEVVPAFANGANVVVMSGRSGTGKTNQFVPACNAKLAGSLSYFADPVDLIWESPEDTAHFIAIDEGQAAWQNGKEAYQRYARLLLKHQAIVIQIADTKLQRDSLRHDFHGIIRDADAAAAAYDLGDVARTYVDEEKASQILQLANADITAQELVRTRQALRNPALFNALFLKSPGITETERFTASDIISTLQRLIRGHNDEKSVALLDDLVGFSENNPDRHALFVAGSTHPADAINLYELSAQPLPDREAFDSRRYGINPYDES